MRRPRTSTEIRLDIQRLARRAGTTGEYEEHTVQWALNGQTSELGRVYEDGHDMFVDGLWKELSGTVLAARTSNTIPRTPGTHYRVSPAYSTTTGSMDSMEVEKKLALT